MKTYLTVLMQVIVCALFAQPIDKEQFFSPNDLESWLRVGDGNAFVTHGQFYMEEVENSKGFMILSPDKYENLILRYEVMTLNPATVLVAILNASDPGESTDLTLADDYDGNFGFWTREAEDYMFGFRVMAHNTTPFIRKHPVTQGKGIIGLAKKDVMHSGWRHLVECGKEGGRIWLKIDNEVIIDAVDPEPLHAGRIAVRVRGTAKELGKCMIRNLVIEGEKVNTSP